MSGKDRPFRRNVGQGDGGHPYSGNSAGLVENEDPARLRANARGRGLFRLTGITFKSTERADAEERLIPFDIIPRIISARELQKLSRGIEQRVRALNAFLHDIFTTVRKSSARRPDCLWRLIRRNDALPAADVADSPPLACLTHIVRHVDLVRTGDEEFYVLEDPIARHPWASAYMLGTAETDALQRLFPSSSAATGCGRLDLPARPSAPPLRCAPLGAGEDPPWRLLTPGIYNSAYFEHAFLADQMWRRAGSNGSRSARSDGTASPCATTQGYQPIDVLYRRVDDEFLDPLQLQPDSALGIPGIMDVYRAGASRSPMHWHRYRRRQGESLQLHARHRGILHRREGDPARTLPTLRLQRAEALAYVLETSPELVVRRCTGSGRLRHA